MFPFPSNGKADPNIAPTPRKNPAADVFPFPSNGKADPKLVPDVSGGATKSFHSLQTGKRIQNDLIAFDEIATFTEFPFPSNGKADPKDPILSPVGPWLQKPENIRELRWAIFYRNLSPKIPQTRVYIERYAIFFPKRLRS